VDAFSNDDHLIKVLHAIQKRPGMFLYPVNLNSLRNFLSGYSSHKLFNRQEESEDKFEKEFFEWICEKEGKKSTPDSGWVEIMEESTSDEESAFILFFEYFNEYLSLTR